MTREEAVKIFNTVLLFGKCDCPKKEIEECLKMAIKALKQKPCEDTISRGAVLDLARKGVLVSICKAINDIPPSGQIE